MTVPLLLSTIQQCIMRFTLDQITFTQISKFFNIMIDSTYDPNPYNAVQEKFKSKLFDIFQTQGANYKDYLNLPKFGSLKLSTQQKLRALFNNIWSEYQSNIQKEKDINLIMEFQKMIPQFKSLHQVQAFHMELLKCFKASRINKQISGTQNTQIQFTPTPSMLPELRYKRPHESTYFMPETYKNYNSNPFAGIINSHNSKVVFPKIEDDPKYSNSIWKDNNYIQNSSNFSIKNSKVPIPHQNNPFSQIQNMKTNHLQKIHSYQHTERVISALGQHLIQNSVQDEDTNKQHLALNDEEFQKKINQLLFIECVCEGSLQQLSAPFIICKKCQFYFHHQCLLVNQDTIIQMCPSCKLKEGSNIFINIHQPAFGKRWCKNMKSQKLSLSLTEKQIQKLKTQKQSCKQPSEIEYQLRFLKMVKKSKEAKRNTNQQQEGGTRRFNNIQLPKNFIEKLQPFNQLQIGLKPTDDDKDEESVYFFAIFLMEKFSERQLTERLFLNINEQNSVDESYIRQFLTPEQDFLEIKMRDPISQKRIVYPSRGDQCEHAEVFDYLSLLEYYKEYGQKLNKKNCTVCEMEIDHVIADRFLLDKIKSYDEQGERDCEFLRYYEDGKVEFIQQQDEIGYSENENDQESDDAEDNSSAESSSN